MKIKSYLKDNFWFISLYLIFLVIILLLLFAFKSNVQLIVALSFLLIFLLILLLVIGFLRKNKYYNELLLNLERLDKKFLVLETISTPNFYEGEILYNILYDVNKSMLENIKDLEISITNFKEYLEMWIHEIKIPVSSLALMVHNHKNDFNKKFKEEIKRVDDLLEQILYFVRSEHAEADYIIKENKLSKVISAVALKNKDTLLENKIDLIVKDIDELVLTDSKWLEFIINQIINNSIKYQDQSKINNYIKIFSEKNNEVITLNIYDNGIGIKKSDLTRVFDKTFTGNNGHKYSYSTGMGLYIVKKLCEKLGHKIEIESKEKEYTLVKIIFYKNDYFNVVK